MNVRPMFGAYRDLVLGLAVVALISGIMLRGGPAELAAQSSNATVDAASGGGWIPGVSDGKATFGLSARIHPDGKVTGHLLYMDRGVDFALESTSIHFFSAFGCQAHIQGEADTSFGPVNFVVGVTDKGEPGKHDTFTIHAVGNTTYFNENVLGGGNIQVHGKACK